jgi:hypothetical protein
MESSLPEGIADKQPPSSPLDAALDYLKANLSIIPIRADGSKRPALPAWGLFQKRLASEKLVRGWWEDGSKGIGILCGAVSGNLECIDFDRADLFEPWRDLVETQAPGLVTRLCIVRTPREPAGYHVRYRCRETPIPGSMKLAQEPAIDSTTGKPNLRTLIETRGEGGYALAPGSPPTCHETGRTYNHIAGPRLTDLADITAQEREILIAAARSFDLATAAKTKRPADASSEGHVNLRPGDDFDQRGPSWSSILEPHGWERAFSRGETTYWRRPDKEAPGISATTGYCKGQDGADLLAVFSTNAFPFEGANGTSSCTCYRKFAAYTLLNHNGDFSAAARELAQQGYGDQRNNRNGSEKSMVPRPESDSRPLIYLSPDEHIVNDAAAAALAKDHSVFQRAGVCLVQVVRDPNAALKNGISRQSHSPRIVPMPLVMVRDRLTANAIFVVKQKIRGGEIDVRVHPPGWCVSAVASRGQWKGIRSLEGVVDGPILRPDGTILDQPGYDPVSGLLYEPGGDLIQVEQFPTLEAVRQARDALLDVVVDFPFANEFHKATWLAAVLTPLSRYAFKGPAPLILIDSNVRGSGKGLLCDIVAIIGTGRSMPTMANSGDEDEWRKRVTALALGGDQLVLIDNIAGSLGNAALDAALTSDVWRDRILGRTEIVEMPLRATWFATGNNVVLLADTARRVAHVRLESRMENPEEREGFKYPNLRGHVRENRNRLLAAALTILRGYFVAGKPSMGLKPWGSFEGWSDLVRSAIVWCGLSDPGGSRKELREGSDQEASALHALLTGIDYLDPTGVGLTVSEIIRKVNSQETVRDPLVLALREAITVLCPARGKDFPGTQSIGMKLNHVKGRVAGGKWLVNDKRNNTGVWMVQKTGDGN